jgi:hypothetical protein
MRTSDPNLGVVHVFYCCKSIHAEYQKIFLSKNVKKMFLRPESDLCFEMENFYD